MKTGYSIKEATKLGWKQFYFQKKLKKYYDSLSIWQRIKFVIWGEF